jgi:glycosyltransferase involved in cell wall biosynthesis
MKASVILSTYNAPEWLEKVLWGYSTQEERNFEIVVADDGSGPETKRLLQTMQRKTGLQIKHIWHVDIDFRKTIILNKATMAAESDYLIYSDGDCIPRKDFIGTHLRLRRAGRFLSGGIVRLPMELSKRISAHDILDDRISDVNWLRRNGLPINRKTLLLVKHRFLSPIMDRITPTRATWNGHNSSAWREDIIAANGFDERMKYGGLDRELGERLVNSGIRPIQIRHRSSCIHLDHAKPWESPESWYRNSQIRRETRRSGRTVTEYGITQRRARAA